MGRTAIVAAAKTVLETVTGIGEVRDRSGGDSVWVKWGAAMPQWEISISGAEQVQVAAVREIERPFVLRVEGFLGRHFDQNTAASWRDLVDAVELALLNAHRTMGGTWNEGSPPNTIADDEIAENEEVRERLAHHVVIEVRGIVELTHS